MTQGRLAVSSIGVPELVIVLMFALFWIVPVLVAIWALVTLHRIRAEQQAVHVKLDAIERLLRRPS